MGVDRAAPTLSSMCVQVCVCVCVCARARARVLIAQSYLTLFDPRLLWPWDSPGNNTGMGCHSLLQGIFPMQGSNLGLLHCSWILYPLSHKTHCQIISNDKLFQIQGKV